MYLKKLELNGFKSFAEKTELLIPTGITAVVGPNGCGKTNIVEAINWVLGEQSARQLRGYKMEDVIFNGTAQREPIGMAEVSLHLDNSDGSLPLDFSEVTLTRRVFRSGESQYSINKKPCRLRDITELMLGTGLGKRSYALVGQGQVDQILHAPPEERRLLLEEAAGISKYRQKQEEALRKLETTQNNLARVDDIVKEVKRQLEVVKKQARRAESYRRLRDRLREMEITSSLIQREELKSKKLALLKQRRVLEDAYQDREGKLKEVENEYTALRNALRDKENYLNQLRTEQITDRAEIDKAQHEIKVNRERIVDLENSQERLKIEIDDIRANLAGREKELRHLQKNSEKIKAENSLKTKQLMEQERNLKAVRRERQEAEKKLKEGREEVIGLNLRAARMGNEFSGLEEGSKKLVLRRRKLEVEIEKLKSEEEEIQREVNRVSADCGEAEKEEQELKEKLARAEKDWQEEKKRFEALGQQKDNLRLMLKEKQSRRDMLEKWDLLSGVDDDGRKLVLEEAGRQGSSLKGVIGPVTDLIDIDTGYEKAVEAALGENLAAIVVEKLEDALAAIKFLKKSKARKARFVILAMLKKNSVLTEKEERARPRPAQIISHVRFMPPLVGRGDFLFQDAVVVSDISRAPMGAGGGGHNLFLTPGGEALSSAGIISWIGLQASPPELFSRKRYLESLESEIGDLLIRIGSLEEEERKLADILRKFQVQINDFKQEVHQKEVERVLGQSELQRLGKNRERLHLLKQAEENELAALKEEQESIIGRREELRLEIDSGAGQDGQLSARLKSIEADLNKLLQKERACGREVTELKIDLASSREREEAMENRRQMLASEAAEYKAAWLGRKKQMEEGRGQRAELKKENQRLQTLIQNRLQNAESRERLLKTAEVEVKRLNQEYEDKEKTFQKLRPHLQEAQARLNEQDFSLAEVRLKADSLSQKVRDQFRVELDQLEFPPSAPPLTVLEEKIERLRSRLDRMTNINLAALEDKENFEARLKLLVEQKEDLESAHSNIEEAIRKINNTAREKLSLTFTAVRRNFQELFHHLFEGGKADLVLDNEANILDSGLDIIAQPPGKKLSHISLLSGGEKALTTIALIFSFFKVQSSPFYLLDEIDAPLDEANIGRFVKLLSSLVSEAQFIIVTHNKRTISEADVLYGITMEETGVSKVVSVKFKH